MKNLIFILILLSTFGVFAEKPKLAVMNFTDETEGKLSKDLVKNGSKLIRSRFTRNAKEFFEVVTDKENEAALAAMKKESYRLDRDRAFQIELGKQVSAAKIVMSTIGNLDKKTFLITSTLTDVARGIDDTSADAIFDGTAEGLSKAVDEIIIKLLGFEDESLIPKKPKMSEDQLECKNAKTENTAESWETYLEFYPRGVCAQEAKEKLDEIACQQALRANTIEALQEYLDNFNGKCKVEASKNIKKLKKAASKSNSSYNNPQNHGGNSNSAADSANTELVGNREWSELSEKKMNFREAKNYCKKLRDNGNSDWRLPTIDELRTLIKSCPGSETFGACKISEAENCLSNACISDRYCECGPNSMGEHSKLEDTAIIWSSSSKTGANDRIFIVDFLRGGISTNSVETRNNVRCTR